MNVFFESVNPDLMTLGQLLESMNYIPELEDVTHEYPIGIEKYENFKAYRSNKGDNIITFKKDGAHEIHHADENFVSGRIKHQNENGKRNYTFVPTMFHIAKKFVDDGKTVRIVASANNDGGNLIGKYHDLAKTIKSKYNFHVSDLEPHEPDDTTYNSNGDEIIYKKFYVKPHNITEAIKIISKTIK